MHDFIAANVNTIGGLLQSEYSIVSPHYQRAFSWGGRECSRFVEDIWEALDAKREYYFLGSFVIDVSEDGKLNIVDGQQRLTTASIMLIAVRNILIESGETTRADAVEKRYLLAPDDKQPRFLTNYQDSVFYNRYILPRQTTPEVKKLTIKPQMLASHKRLAKALQNMHDMLLLRLRSNGSLTDFADEIEQAFDKVVLLVQVDVDGYDNADIIFQTLNDRGKDVDGADLLKNHLFSTAGKVQRPLVMDAWKGMQDNLADTSIVDFLHHDWLSRFQHIDKKNIYKEVTKRTDTPETVVNYIKEIVSSSGSYAALLSCDHDLWSAISPDTEREIEICGLIDFVRMLGTKMQWITLLASMDSNRENFADMLAMLSAFVFRYSKICGRELSQIADVFIAAAHHIRTNPGVTAKEIFGSFFAKFCPSDAEFTDAFTRFTCRRPSALARYIIARINDQMQGLPPMTTMGMPEAETIEHVLPRKFNESWQEELKQFGNKPDEFVYRLGNITLLPAKANHLLGNASFARKCATYKEYPLAVSAGVTSAKEWTAQKIEARQREMAGVAARVWRCQGV